MSDEITDQFGFKATLMQLSKDLSQLFRRVSQLETTTVPVISGGGSGAPNSSSYVTIGLDGLLSNERRIQVTGGATGVDSGANADYTITVHNAVTLDANADTVFSLTTQAIGLDAQIANSVFAGPSLGVPAVPTFRTLTTTDIPDLSGTYQPLDADLTAISGISVTRGDIIVGNSTPTWDDLALGGISGSLLTRDASDVLWSTFAVSGTAAQTYTFPTTSGTVTFGTGTSGQVAFFNGTNSIISDAGLLWDNTNKMLGVGVSPTYVVDIYGANEVYNTPIFRVSKSSVTALVSSNLVALFQNTGDTIGGSDYQNEVHVGLKAGTTTRHRRYLSFRTHTDAVDWLTGANAASAYILYDGTSICHRAFFNNTSDSNGYTYLSSAGTGIIRFNLHSDANTGTGGVEFGPGGGTTTSTAIINGSGAFAFKSAILSTYTGVIRGEITAIAGDSNGGLYVAPEINPPADSAIANYGIYSNPVTKNNFNIRTIAGVAGAVTHGYAGTVSTAYGLMFAIHNTGAGIISTAYGINARITNSGGGTVTTATAFYVPELRTSGGSTTGTFYGLRIMDSTATNLTVGIRNEITSGSTKYCFYSSGTAKSWFRGDISFGSTAVFAPGALLHAISNDAAKIGVLVKGAAAQTANLIEFQDSGSAIQAYVESDGEIVIPQDSKSIKLGGGSDMAIYYDGTTGNIDTDIVAASDLVIDCGANKTITLEVQVYDDLRVTPADFNRAGISDPALVSYTPTGSSVATYLYEFQVDDIAYFTVQLPHSYKVGEDIKVHVHWTPGLRGNEESGNTVGWKVDYAWANINGTFGAMQTADLSDACDGTDDKHQMTPEFTIDGHTAPKSISSMLICNIKRTDTGADDTWAGTASGQLPMILEIDFHYPIDTLGSRDWGTK